MLVIVDLDSGRETGRALHHIKTTPKRAVQETTGSVSVRFDRLGRYVYRFLVDDEMIGFTTVDVVSFPTP